MLNYFNPIPFLRRFFVSNENWIKMRSFPQCDCSIHTSPWLTFSSAQWRRSLMVSIVQKILLHSMNLRRYFATGAALSNLTFIDLSSEYYSCIQRRPWHFDGHYFLLGFLTFSHYLAAYSFLQPLTFWNKFILMIIFYQLFSALLFIYIFPLFLHLQV